MAKAQYGPAHRRLRTSWEREIKAGDVACVRCGFIIEPGSRWTLGHDHVSGGDNYIGPEHERCGLGERNRRVAREKRRGSWPEDLTGPSGEHWSRPWFSPEVKQFLSGRYGSE